jgi:hypothetical protein
MAAPRCTTLKLNRVSRSADTKQIMREIYTDGGRVRKGSRMLLTTVPWKRIFVEAGAIHFAATDRLRVRAPVKNNACWRRQSMGAKSIEWIRINAAELRVVRQSSPVVSSHLRLFRIEPSATLIHSSSSPKKQSPIRTGTRSEMSDTIDPFICPAVLQLKFGLFVSALKHLTYFNRRRRPMNSF